MANLKACALQTFPAQQPWLYVYHSFCSWCYVAAEMILVCCNIIGGCHDVFRLSTCSVATYPLSTHCPLTVPLLSITLITGRA